jgi:hypothetical protein
MEHVPLFLRFSRKAKTVSFGGVCPDAPNWNVGMGVPKTHE